MDEYEDINLNIEKTIGYLEKCLASGNTLAKHLLTAVNLKNGRVSTAIPINGNRNNIYDFKKGKIFPEYSQQEMDSLKERNGTIAIWMPIHYLLEPIVKTVNQYIVNNNCGVCLLEEAFIESTDRWLENIETQILTINGEVYHYIDKKNNTVSNIKMTIYNAPDRIIGVLTTFTPAIVNSISQRTMNLDMLNIVAKRTEKIIVSAYDGEGYLVWHKSVDSE